MIRRFTACAAALVVTAAAAHAGDAHTTRIEQSNAYGATVTIEEGVRVFRPLPPDRHVIIVPEGRTPLSVNILDGAVPVTGVTRR